MEQQETEWLLGTIVRERPSEKATSQLHPAGEKEPAVGGLRRKSSPDGRNSSCSVPTASPLD
jgi:hypothetical protein